MDEIKFDLGKPSDEQQAGRDYILSLIESGSDVARVTSYEVHSGLRVTVTLTNGVQVAVDID